MSGTTDVNAILGPKPAAAPNMLAQLSGWQDLSNKQLQAQQAQASIANTQQNTANAALENQAKQGGMQATGQNLVTGQILGLLNDPTPITKDRYLSTLDLASRMNPALVTPQVVQAAQAEIPANASDADFRQLLTQRAIRALPANMQAERLLPSGYTHETGNGTQYGTIAGPNAAVNPGVPSVTNMQPSNQMGQSERLSPFSWTDTAGQHMLFKGDLAGTQQDQSGVPQAPGYYGAVGTRINSFENSTGNPNAVNPASGATGNGQFLDTTWLPLIKQSFPQLAAGKSDQQLLALRGNPQIAQQMTEVYARQNAGALAQAGVPATPDSLYLAHLTGPGGAISIETADPNTPLSKILSPAAIQANPAYANMTAGQLRAMAAQRMGVPMAQPGAQVAQGGAQPAAGSNPPAATTGASTGAPGPASGMPAPRVTIAPGALDQQADNVKAYQTDLDNVPQLKRDIQNLGTAYNLYNGLSGGAGLDWVNQNRSRIVSFAKLAGVDAGDLDNQDARRALANKLLQQVVNNNPGSGRSDQALAATAHGSPNTDQMNSTAGLQAIRELIGDKRMQLGALLNTNPSDAANYKPQRAQYVLNHDRDAFSADYMTPGEIHAHVVSLGGPKAAAAKEFLQGVGELQKRFGRGVGESREDIPAPVTGG